MKIKKITDLLSPQGFISKGNNFTKKINNTITYTVNLQKSAFSDGYYINCKVAFESEKISFLSFRISDSNKLTDKSLFDLTNKNDIDFITEKLNQKFIETFVFFGYDKSKIKEYVLSKPGVILNEGAKHFLDIKSETLVF